MLGEVAKLIVEMNLGGNLKSGISGIEKQLAGLNTSTKTVGGGFKTLGAGFLVAGIKATALLAAQSGAVAGAVGVMIKEGQDAAKVQTIYATAVANSGKVSTQYVSILNAQQKSLEHLGGLDDELIKTEQTRLIQMGLNGEQVAKLTPLILDMSKATGRDLLTSTLAVGKATNGNVAGLQRYGIMIDKAKAKVDPFGAVIDALNKKFGGTTQALSGNLETRLGDFRASLQDIREEAGIKLLPAITRIVDVAAKDLVPAFGKFIDRIMPSLLEQVNKFADLLENGGAERGIKAITDALGPMIDMLKIAAAPVKAIVSAFLSLPSQVQGVLVGGFALNKLSGGLIGQGAGQIVKGALGGVLGGFLQRGGSPATPMFVSDVSGGLGGGIAGKAGGLVGALGAGGVAGLATITSGVLGILGAYWLIGEVAKGNPAQRPIETRPSSAAAFTTATTGYMSADALGMGIGNYQNLVRQYGGGQYAADTMKPTPGFGNSERSGLAVLPTIAKTLTTTATTLTAIQVGLRQDFSATIAALRKATTPAAIVAAVNALTKDVRGGVGNEAQTKALVAELTTRRDAALKAGDKATADALSASIKSIAGLVPGRAHQAAVLRKADKIVASNQSTKTKIEELKGLQRDMIAVGRTTAANIIQSKIAIVNAIHGIRLGSIPAYVPGTKQKGVHHAPGTGPLSAGGAIGLTRGLTQLGWAGEAGNEAVAIIRRPRAITGGEDRNAIVSAIRSVSTPSVHLSVTSSDVSKANATRNRTVKPHSPRGTLTGPLL